MPKESFRIGLDSEDFDEYLPRLLDIVDRFGIIPRMASAPFRLFVFGRLHGVPRQRLTARVAQVGGCLVPSPSSRVELVAVGHSTASLIGAAPNPIPREFPETARVISELSLKRMLGLAPSRPPEHHTLTEADVARAVRLDPGVIRCLTLYDVLEPAEERHGYGDLLAARAVSRLLQNGLALDQIVTAALVLRRAGRGLSDMRLCAAPWGEIMHEAAGRLERLDGQLTLPLEEPYRSVDEVFERAQASEIEGDLATAERWYEVAKRMDRHDPVLPFNLGNVRDAQGRHSEAALAYREAVARDPAFAEAWFNLGALQESADRFDDALASYGNAVEARPDYADAVFCRARLLTKQERCGEGLGLWERYLRLQPNGTETAQARRLAALCRLRLRSLNADPQGSR